MNTHTPVIAFTGLPCSGKTTISIELEKQLVARGLQVRRLDGDVVRTTVCKDLGFSKSDRKANIERLSHIAKMFSENNVVVIMAFVSPYEDIRQNSREIIGDAYVEVFVDTPLAECKKRDVKGMYKMASEGKMKGFTGVDDPYEIPSNSDIVIQTADVSPLDNSEQIIDFLLKYDRL